MSVKQVQDDLIDIQGRVLKIFEKYGYHYNCECHADIMRVLESKKSNFENLTPEGIQAFLDSFQTNSRNISRYMNSGEFLAQPQDCMARGGKGRKKRSKKGGTNSGVPLFLDGKPLDGGSKRGGAGRRGRGNRGQSTSAPSRIGEESDDEGGQQGEQGEDYEPESEGEEDQVQVRDPLEGVSPELLGQQSSRRGPPSTPRADPRAGPRAGQLEGQPRPVGLPDAAPNSVQGAQDAVSQMDDYEILALIYVLFTNGVMVGTGAYSIAINFIAGQLGNTIGLMDINTACGLGSQQVRDYASKYMHTGAACLDVQQKWEMIIVSMGCMMFLLVAIFSSREGNRMDATVRSQGFKAVTYEMVRHFVTVLADFLRGHSRDQPAPQEDERSTLARIMSQPMAEAASAVAAGAAASRSALNFIMSAPQYFTSSNSDQFQEVEEGPLEGMDLGAIGNQLTPPQPTPGQPLNMDSTEGRRLGGPGVSSDEEMRQRRQDTLSRTQSGPGGRKKRKTRRRNVKSKKGKKPRKTRRKAPKKTRKANKPKKGKKVKKARKTRRH